MATLQTVETRDTGTNFPAGKAYFETSTNKFIVWNGTQWIELHSDGTGSAFINDYSVSFTHGKYLTTNYSHIPNGTDYSFSMSYWIRLNSQDYSRNTGLSPTIGSNNAGAGGFYLLQASSVHNSFPNGLILAWYTTAGQPANSGWAPESLGGIGAAAPLGDGEWHHIALTVASDGINKKVYFDGGDSIITASNASNNAGSPFATVTGSAYGGSRSGFSYKIGSFQNDYYGLDGNFDEIAFFETELSGSDVAAIYNGGLPDSLTAYNPAALFRMGDDDSDSPVDGGSVASITDSSGNGYTATQATASIQPTFSTSVPS